MLKALPNIYYFGKSKQSKKTRNEKMFFKILNPAISEIYLAKRVAENQAGKCIGLATSSRSPIG